MHARFLNGTIAAAMAAMLTVVAGCGGGGSDGSDDQGGTSVVAPGGNNLQGPADPIQDTLGQVGDTNGDLAVAGDTSEALVSALISLLDVTDGLAIGFQDFLISQDAADLLSGGEAAGDALLSFAAGLEEALIQLTKKGEAIPGLEGGIAELQALQRQIQDGTTGATDGGDLTLLTDTLVALSEELGTLAQQSPAALEGAPLTGELLAALSQGSADLATVLDAVGRLNGADTSAALVTAFENVASNLTDALPADSPLDGAVADATANFERGLALLLDPLFQALRGVLAPVTGAQSPLDETLFNLLAGNLTGLGGVEGLQDTLSGGGMAPDGTAVPVLGDLLAGLPVLGDLLGAQLGGDVGGGLSLIEDLLSGSGDLPLLGDLLQGLPGLTGPGGDAPSLPLVGDLLTTLLSLNGDGVPVISELVAAGTEGGEMQVPLIGDLIDELLDQLLGMAGGVDSTGGFLDGLGGIPVLGALLDSLLGGLSV